MQEKWLKITAGPLIAIVVILFIVLLQRQPTEPDDSAVPAPKQYVEVLPEQEVAAIQNTIHILDKDLTAVKADT